MQVEEVVDVFEARAMDLQAFFLTLPTLVGRFNPCTLVTPPDCKFLPSSSCALCALCVSGRCRARLCSHLGRCIEGVCMCIWMHGSTAWGRFRLRWERVPFPLEQRPKQQWGEAKALFCTIKLLKHRV